MISWSLDIILLNFVLGINGKYDIILVIDASGKGGRKTFRKVSDIFRLLSTQFYLNPLQTRIGLLSYGSSPRTILRLEQGVDKDTINAVLPALQAETGEPHLNAALQRVIQLLGDRNEPSRRDVPTKVVVYASDISQDSIEAAALSLDELNRRNAQVIMLMVNDDEKMKKDAVLSIPGSVKVVSSTLNGLFGEPYSLLTKTVAERPGLFKCFSISHLGSSHAFVCEIFIIDVEYFSTF